MLVPTSRYKNAWLDRYWLVIREKFLPHRMHYPWQRLFALRQTTSRTTTRPVPAVGLVMRTDVIERIEHSSAEAQAMMKRAHVAIPTPPNYVEMLPEAETFQRCPNPSCDWSGTPRVMHIKGRAYYVCPSCETQFYRAV